MMLRAPSKRRIGNSKTKTKKMFFNESSQCNAIIESSEGHKICIDTLYLSQYSDFFKCAFYGFNNEFVERKRRKVRFETISHEKLLSTFNLLKLLTSPTSRITKHNESKSLKSTGNDEISSHLIQQMSLNTALDLLDVAAYLQIELLLKELSNAICQKVTTSTLLMVHRKAEKRYPSLAHRLWRMIVEEFKILVKAENFVELTAGQMLALLRDSKLNLDPADEFLVVTKWLEVNSVALCVDSDEADVDELRLAVTKAQLFSSVEVNVLASALADFAPSASLSAYGASNPSTQSRSALFSTHGIGFFDRPRIPQSILLAVGGWATGGPTNQLEFYEPNRRRWMPVQLQSRLSCPERRAYHSLVYNSANSEESVVYMLGGYDGLRHHKSIHKLNLNSLNWVEVAPMNEQRCYVSGTMIDSNHLMAVGGFNEDNRLRSAEIFNIDRNQWSLVAPMNAIRSDADCVNVDGRIFAVGGFNGSTCHDSCEVYDVTLNTWTPLRHSMRFKRSGVKALCVSDRVLVVVGGFTGAVRLRTPEFYDLREGTWHVLADMINKRSNFGIHTLDSRIMVCGGYNNVSTTNLCEAFDWRANAWAPMPEMSFSRSALSVCRIDRHALIEQIVEEFDHNAQLPLFA